jgi:hypothetical protein
MKANGTPYRKSQALQGLKPAATLAGAKWGAFLAFIEANHARRGPIVRRNYCYREANVKAQNQPRFEYQSTGALTRGSVWIFLTPPMHHGGAGPRVLEIPSHVDTHQ